MKVGIVQLTSSNSIPDNLDIVATKISELVNLGVNLVVLPENFAAFGLKQYETLATVEEKRGNTSVITRLCQLASLHHIWICAGTVPLPSIANPGAKPNATTLLIDDKGVIVARYNKIHLFDALVSDDKGRYRESDSYQAGRTLTVVDTAFGRVGLAVCYDLRFAELFLKFRQLGVEIVLLPSAFTAVTGDAHWEALIRCRAIENGFYIIAANQGGTHFNNRKTWGHSMIVDPWGNILTELESAPGIGMIDIDVSVVKKTRENIPTQWHREQRRSRNLQW